MLATWVNQRAVPGAAAILLITDAAYGTNMLSVPALRLSSPAYDVARTWASMRVWGLVFVALSAISSVVLVQWRDHRAAYSLVPMSAYWAFWAVLFLCSALVRPGVSWAGVVIGLGMTALHMWISLCLSYRHHTGRD